MKLNREKWFCDDPYLTDKSVREIAAQLRYSLSKIRNEPLLQVEVTGMPPVHKWQLLEDLPE